MKIVKYCLLIESDPHDQELFIDALHHVSSTTGCYVVANGEEALFALTEEGYSPDYIFTDLKMPGMDGFEFLKIFRDIEKFKIRPLSSTRQDILKTKFKKPDPWESRQFIRSHESVCFRRS